MRDTPQEGIIFVTGNAEKFQIAQAVCKKQDIALTQKSAEIDEIQSEDIEVVVRDKARRAFAIFQQPLVVNDISWSIPALRGFPGPYMKSIVHWLTPDDWLHLMGPYSDRRIVLIELLAYQDERGCNIFRKEFTGKILHTARGNYGSSLHKIITMPGDNGLSVAEVYDKGILYDEREVTASWVTFLGWYRKCSIRS